MPDAYFDGQPYGHSFSRSYVGGRRAGDAPGWAGPPDPTGCPECGAERPPHADDCPERRNQ